jgi:hypothetical protein
VSRLSIIAFRTETFFPLSWSFQQAQLRERRLRRQVFLAMRPIYTVEEPLHAPIIKRSGRRWLLGALIGLAVLAFVSISLLALNWPFTKQAVIDALQESSVRSVTIDRFYRTYWPPGCVAEGISFLRRKQRK